MLLLSAVSFDVAAPTNGVPFNGGWGSDNDDSDSTNADSKSTVL
jgi:hypothetical protein